MSAFEPYEGTDPYIFISYARKDKDRVFPLLDALRDLGYRIWRDEGGIPWGVKWMATIEDHLTRAAVCLVFWSEASAASEHCEAEAGAMVSEQKPIVTVFLDDTPLTPGLRMYLQQFQTVKLADFDSDTAFIERLDRERVFASCKAPPKTETPPVTAPLIVSAPKIETPPAPKIAPTIERSTGEATVRPVPRIPTVLWNKNGKIQWYLDRDGVLTIAKNEDLRSYETVPMPDYANNHASTAPWMRPWEKIRSVVILDDIATIGESAFWGCAGLTSVTIGNSVITIGDRAFEYCEHLTSVMIPDSVISIGDGAFYGCMGLTSVKIGNSVTTVGDGAFHGCTGLMSVTVPAGTKFTRGLFASFPDHVKIIRRPPR